MPINRCRGNRKARKKTKSAFDDRKMLRRRIIFSFTLLGVIAAGIYFFCFDNIQPSATFDPVYNRHVKTKGGIAVVIAIGVRYGGEFFFDQLCYWLDKRK